MSDQTPNQSSNPSPTPPPTPPTYSDWRAQRRAERMARREARLQRYGRRPYGWIWGAILILLGLIFLLQNLGLPILFNWWAVFILIPAIWAFVAAWNIYQDNGRLTRAAAGSLTVGILLTLLTVILLLNLELGMYWPILLILGGLILLASAFVPR
jgi:hypothetical protein